MHILHILHAWRVGKLSSTPSVGFPSGVDARLRQRARQEGKSLNEVAVEALAGGLGLSDEEGRFTDLDDLAGSWVADAAFDHAIVEMDKVDEELWK